MPGPNVEKTRVGPLAQRRKQNHGPMPEKKCGPGVEKTTGAVAAVSIAYNGPNVEKTIEPSAGNKILAQSRKNNWAQCLKNNTGPTLERKY